MSRKNRILISAALGLVTLALLACVFAVIARYDYRENSHTKSEMSKIVKAYESDPEKAAEEQKISLMEAEIELEHAKKTLTEAEEKMKPFAIAAGAMTVVCAGFVGWAFKKRSLGEPSGQAKRAQNRQKTVRLAVLAMMLALYVVLNRFVSISTLGTKIGFSVIAPMIAALLYGPFEGALVYGLGDFLSAILFPFGPYHPGFTLTAALMGFIWGVFLRPDLLGIQNAYVPGKKGAKNVLLLIAQIVLPAVVNCLVIGLVINTEWVAQLYGSKTYGAWFVSRLTEYAIMVPVNVILAVMLTGVAATLRRQGFGKKIKKQPKTATVK